MLNPAFSIVVPVHNEERSLPILVDEIRAALDFRSPDYEILFVDDCSDDRSLEVLRTIAAHDDRVRVFHLRRHSGQSAGLAAGFARALAPVVVTMDADLQNDPADIPRVLEALDRCDVVSGVREERRDPWTKRAASRVANLVRSRVLRDSIHDVGCSLKAYRRERLQNIPVFDGFHRFLPMLLEMEGARVTEVAVRHRPRRFGRSNYSTANRLWHVILDLSMVRWMQHRWIDRTVVENVPTRPVAAAQHALREVRQKGRIASA